jgi:hypothetical protein
MDGGPSALVLLAELLTSRRLMGDHDRDADWLCEELHCRGLRVCILARSKRRCPASHNRKVDDKHCRIENAVAPLKDWRAIVVRYTRCGDTFLPTITLALTDLFWLLL